MTTPIASVKGMALKSSFVADDAYTFRHVVLQPTSGCNLNCSYCYLPDRARPQEMTVEVTTAIADTLTAERRFFYVLWHGGEPLSCGLSKFRQLVGPFTQLRESGLVRHSLQTNATLLNPAWCDFLKTEGFRVGVSLDGPRELNGGRVNWSKKPSFESAMRGIDLLTKYGIPFGIIAVVNGANLEYPRELYKFFQSIPCRGLNINIEEREGLNQGNRDLDSEKVRAFWQELFQAWKSDPTLPIREFEDVLGWMRGICEGQGQATPRTGDLWPTVAFNGDVVVLSPELVAAKKHEVGQFIVGNVLRTTLSEIVRQSKAAKYVQEYFEGKEMCRQSCDYFSYCGGGQPSNKYFELGRMNVTETAHCRNTRQAVVDAVVSSLESCLVTPFAKES